MLDIANDIRSLSDFKRNTSDLLERLKKTGNPLVLTINGKAEVVVQDAEAYQSSRTRADHRGDSAGLADVKAGRTKPAPRCSTGFGESMAYRVELAKSAEAELERR
jgi:prevent-host-death family protein